MTAARMRVGSDMRTVSQVRARRTTLRFTGARAASAGWLLLRATRGCECPGMRSCLMPALFVLSVLLTPARLSAQPSPAVPVVELRNGYWFTGVSFERGSRWMRGDRFVTRPRTAADSIVALDGLYMVPPYADAHTHSPDGTRDFDSVRDMYLREGVFYVQVLANHRSGRRALGAQVNAPGTLDAMFADGAVTSTGGHPHVLYELLALFRTTSGTPVQRQQAARSITRDGDVYHRLDSLQQLGALMQRLRRDTVPLMKVILVDADTSVAEAMATARDTLRVGNRGLDPRLLAPLVDSAHALGRRVWVHVETARDFELALDAGVDGFAHVPGYGAAWMPDSLLPRYRLNDAAIARAGRRRVPVITTLGLSYDTTSRDPAALRRTNATAVDNIRRLARAGALVLTGSDTYSSADAIWNDVQAVGRALSLTPTQVLQMRAVDTPRAILPGRRVGAFTPGYEASALALRCDPTRVLACQRQVVRAIKQGQWVSRASRDSTQRR